MNPQPPIFRQRRPDAEWSTRPARIGGSGPQGGPVAGWRACLARQGSGPMKKGGILNPAICSLLAELGQSDELLIVDAAYPLPTDGHVIDLTLTPGIPRLLDVLRAVTEELVIDADHRPGGDQGIQPAPLPGDPQDRRRDRRRRGAVPRVQGAGARRQGHHPLGRVQPVRERSHRGRKRLLSDRQRVGATPRRVRQEVRGGQRKPDSVEPLTGRFHVRPRPG